MVRMGEDEIVPTIWNDVVEIMEKKLKEIEFSGEDIHFDWRIPADARRLDRELFEKYGMFKDIILDPRFQYWKQLVEDNVDFNLLLGEPLMPFATAIIVLFMLHKRVSNNIIALAAAFIFNVNPFYVCMLLFVLWYMNKSIKPKKYRSVKKSQVPKDVLTYRPVAYTPTSAIALTAPGTSFDHVLIGNDLATLYAAAVLSRNGHTCCVLQPRGTAPNRIHPEGTPFPVSTRNPIVGKVERYQSLLDTLQLGGPGGMNKHERVTFSPVGTESDCYTHTVLRLNSSSSSSSSKNRNRAAPASSTWLLRAGEGTLASDLSARLHVDKAAMNVFLKSVVAAQGAVTPYLINKTTAVPDASANTSPAASPSTPDAGASTSGGSNSMIGAFSSVGTIMGGGGGATDATASATTPAGAAVGSVGAGMDSLVAKAEGMAQYMNLSTTAVEQLLTRIPDLDERVYSALAGTAAAGGEEALSASDLTSLSLAHALCHSDQGVYYPHGGYDAIEAALIRCVRAAGGEIHTNVPIRGILCEEDEDGKMRALGVRLHLNEDESGTNDASEETSASATSPSSSSIKGVVTGTQSVVSGVGALCTYTRLLPPEAVSETARRAMSLLVETRPKVLVVFWLHGTQAELGLSSTDYFEMPAQSPSSSGSVALEQGGLAGLTAQREGFAANCVRIWSPSAKDPCWDKNHGGVEKGSTKEHAVVVELEAGEPMVVAKPFKFTAEPSNTAKAGKPIATQAPVIGPRLYVDSTHTGGVATSSSGQGLGEGNTSGGDGDGGLCSVGYTAVMSSSLQEKAKTRALKKLLELYPKLSEPGRIVATHVVPPTLGGHIIVGSPPKYAATELTAKTDVKDLYLTGRDIATSGLAADFQSGWVTANAILGYTTAELLRGKNVATDLAR